MKTKTRTIAERVRYIRKEHSGCREYIEKRGLFPVVYAIKNSDYGLREGWYWDGCFASDSNGDHYCLAGTLPKQMLKMIGEGKFGTAILGAFYDYSSWWKIRDYFRTWPNEAVIKRLGIYQVSLSQMLDN